MTIRATVIADSISPAGKNFTTFEAYYPRAAIHEELLTHRAMSRCAASSRATPIQAMIDAVKRDPALPVSWGINGAGMSDHGVLSPEDEKEVVLEWLRARDDAIAHASRLLARQPAPHKQYVNLLLRPWEHIRVVISATEWSNFYALRRDAAAKPDFKALADAMWEAKKASTPVELRVGEWHLPYIQNHERQGAARSKNPEQSLQNLIKVSAARCARTSYKNHRNKVSSFEEDVELYERLAKSAPMHASPLEHQASPDVCRNLFSTTTKKFERVWNNPHQHGNLIGWIQHRKTLPGENITKYDPEEVSCQKADEPI